MHYVTANGILSPKNGMNIYRGCTHGCIYCDSRSLCYNMAHPFEDVEVKENALELLEKALKGKRKKCMIGTGSMSDPYMPLEKELCRTRRSLELALKYGFGFTLITKSDLVLRDLDLIQKINDRTKCVVQMTLTTFDDVLCRKLEPAAPPTSRRIEVLNILCDAGIPTVVWLTPILPFINDTEQNIFALLSACAGAGVRGVISFGIGLTLREGNREYFYAQLDRLFPGTKERYIKSFGSSYSAVSPNNAKLMNTFHSFCQSRGILHTPEEVFAYLNAFEDKTMSEQTTLF